MTRLEQIIRDEIAERGPMHFARYMDLALYHPDLGFYASGLRRTGWGGQFVTSPELDPAYGELWAAGLEQIWESCRRPSEFTLAELGPGEGSFASAVLGAAAGDFASSLRVLLVERIDALRRRQEDALAGSPNVAWLSSLDEMLPIESGCLFANEVVDNMPVSLVENRGGSLVELCVDLENSELDLVARPPSAEVRGFTDRMGVGIPVGHRMEIPLEAVRFAAAAAGKIRSGAVVLVDYGDHEERLAERPAGTLLCYSGAGVDDHYLERPGTKDITAHANWSALKGAFDQAGTPVAGPASQRDVLKSLGAGTVQDRLRAEADKALRSGSGVAGLRALSRRGALGALLDPGGLGNLEVLVALKGIPPPGFMTAGT